MDHKRKSNGSGGAADVEDRAAKRRRLQEQYPLSKGESRDSTTAYGLDFLDQIRKTQDKSGRLVATAFETLPPRDRNPDYYRKIALPISLEMIEEDLKSFRFRNMAELEGHFKRMIMNAKDIYPRSSREFEDAERVRKTISNYMTKTNPAYQLVRGYAAIPTPLPPRSESQETRNMEPVEAGSQRAAKSSAVKVANGNRAASPEAERDDGEDAEGEDDEEALQDGEEEEEEEEQEQEAEEEDGNDSDDDEEEEEEEDDDSAGDSGPILLKRRGPGRPPKNPVLHARKQAERAAQQPSDTEYKDLDYAELNFQQAQEKIVEELIRKKDEDGYAYFDPFINLPPRALKDYYKIITEPLSLKKLQKLVRGSHGKAVTGASDFKSWNAFEERACLLWKNAYYYNEEGSDIYNLAAELQGNFHEELEQAKAVVQEPPQPKIKIKLPGASEATPNSRRIIVKGSQGRSADSPAPLTSHSTSSRIHESMPIDATPGTPAPAQAGSYLEGDGQSTAPPADKIPANSAADGTPIEPGSNGVSSSVEPQAHNAPPSAGSLYRPDPVTGHWSPTRESLHEIDWPVYRPANRTIKDALLLELLIKSADNIENPWQMKIMATDRNYIQSSTHNIPGYHAGQRIQIIPTFSPRPDEQSRSFVYIAQCNKELLFDDRPQNIKDQDPLRPVFEATLQRGLNNIEMEFMCSVVKGTKLPNGLDVELERITVMLNVLPWMH